MAESDPHDEEPEMAIEQAPALIPHEELIPHEQPERPSVARWAE